MQERFNIKNQYKQVQGRKNNNNDIGLNRWEWVTEMHRDTLNSNIQNQSRLNYFSICENVPSQVIQRRMKHQMILPVGPRPNQNQIINNNMLSKNYIFFYEKIQQEKNLFQLWQTYNQLLTGQKENAFVRIQNFGNPQEDDLQDIIQLFLRSRNIQKRYWINDLWALYEEIENINEQDEEQEEYEDQDDQEKVVYISNLSSDSDRKISLSDNSFISDTKNIQKSSKRNESIQSQEDSQDNDQKILLNEILNIVRLIQNNMGGNQNSNQIEILIKNLITKEGSSKVHKNLKFNDQKNQYQIQQVLAFVLLNIFNKKKDQQKKFVLNRFKFLCRFQQNRLNQKYDQEVIENFNLVLKQKLYQHKLNFFLELKNIENFAEKLYSRYLDQQQNDYFFINLEEDYLKKVDKKSFLKQLNQLKIYQEIFKIDFFIKICKLYYRLVNSLLIQNNSIQRKQGFISQLKQIDYKHILCVVKVYKLQQNLCIQICLIFNCKKELLKLNYKRSQTH